MSLSSTRHVEAANQYIADVVAGRILVCRWVRLACERQLRDLERARSKDYPYRFDVEKAGKVCKLIEVLPHVKGKWARKTTPIVLEPWQCFPLTTVFGWVSKEDGLRRFRTAYEEVPRKNGKSIKAAGVGVHGLVNDDEPGAEVYCGATTQKQAYEVFKPAKMMVDATPELREVFGIVSNASNLSLADGSKFEPVIGKPGDGASPSVWIVDEFHEHLTWDQVDTARTGMGAREQGLMYFITTAGDNLTGPCYKQREEVIKMLEDTIPNEELFGIIYTIDEGDDWKSLEALKKANPNYGISADAKFLLLQQRDAINNAAKQATFKTKHLNIWVSERAGFFNMDTWARLGDDGLKVEDFEGCSCYVGVQMASKKDIASLVRVFAREEDDGEVHYYLFSRHYVPQETTEEPELKHYADWALNGQVVATDGSVIDIDRIERDLVKDDTAHAVTQLAYDPANAEQFRQRMENLGMECIAIPRRYQHYSEPMKWQEALMKAGRLHHDGNQALTWMVSNVIAKEDPAENIMPTRQKGSTKPIYGATALIMALGRAMMQEDGAESDDTELVEWF